MGAYQANRRRPRDSTRSLERAAGTADRGHQARERSCGRAARSHRSRSTHELVISHGNGPQVVLLALRVWLLRSASSPISRPASSPETRWMIGYLLQPELGTSSLRDPTGDACLTLSRSMRRTRPCGSDQADRADLPEGRGRPHRARSTGFKPDGDSFRLSSLSPPQRIFGLSRSSAVDSAALPLLPRRRDSGDVCRHRSRPGGGSSAVEAVIDRILASAVLAAAIGAQALRILTARRRRLLRRGSRSRGPITLATPEALAVESRGVDGPEGQAACQFRPADRRGSRRSRDRRRARLLGAILTRIVLHAAGSSSPRRVEGTVRALQIKNHREGFQSSRFRFQPGSIVCRTGLRRRAFKAGITKKRTAATC